MSDILNYVLTTQEAEKLRLVDEISLDRIRELAESERETYRNATQVTGYCQICAERAKQEQQNPQPLTIEDLSKLASKDPVWGSHCFVKSLESGKVYHALVDIDSNGIVVIIGAHKTLLIDTYGTLWIAYAHEPKGEHHE